MTTHQSAESGDGSPAGNSSSSDSFPIAQVKAASDGGILKQSKMWWITLACLVLAILLAWRSIPDNGPAITIRFPEGHGLKSGDAVRFRGIDVGTVTDVSLNERLSGVVVHVTLTPGGSALNREGTRFWIVRPQLSLTEISGLETAVGSKYIGVSPGDPGGEEVHTFEGLAIPPPDELSDNGLELILQSDQRHGISAGAPVTWRGVDVGRVLSAGLSPDARHVNVSIRIDGPYRRLVRPNSRFWVTSGFRFDLGLSGVKLNADSLASIARGGVSFITPDASAGEDSVSDGHVFDLESRSLDEWIESSEAAPLVDFPLPETVLIRGKRKTSFIGIRRTKEFTQTGLLLTDASGTRILTAELPTEQNESDQPVVTDFDVQPVGGESSTISGVNPEDCEYLSNGVISVPVHSSALRDRSISLRQRELTEPEECLVTRSASADGNVMPTALPIERSQLLKQETTWVIQNAGRELKEWHGAPVVAASDGKVVGLLIITEQGPVIASLNKSSVPE